MHILLFLHNYIFKPCKIRLIQSCHILLSPELFVIIMGLFVDFYVIIKVFKTNDYGDIIMRDFDCQSTLLLAYKN